MSKSKKKRPLMQPFGYISLDSWIAYIAENNSIIISDDKCPRCRKSDYPRLFVDIEMVEDMVSKAYRGLQVHMALSGRETHWERARRRLSRSRVDIYLSKDSALSLYKLLATVLKELGLLSK